MSGRPTSFVLDSREQLLNALAEAAEIEHHLMCCYLYAAFSCVATCMRRSASSRGSRRRDGVEGNVELCSGTGRTFERTTSVRLCRCGASEKKPFCAGSHTRVGFHTE